MSRSTKPYKDSLIDKLWLPMARQYGSVLRPRLRKNRRLKTLSLTSDRDYVEITRLIEEGLTYKQNVFLWTYDHFKKMRLESEGFQVLVPARYEHTVTSSPDVIAEYFPFGMMNLDFLSQDPETSQGRMELEIESIEATFGLQVKDRQNSPEGFILIYTTLVDEKPVDVRSLIGKLNSYHVDGWGGLEASSYSNLAATLGEKTNTVKKILKTIPGKYGYKLLGCHSATVGSILSVVLAVKRI